MGFVKQDVIRLDITSHIVFDAHIEYHMTSYLVSDMCVLNICL